MEKVSVSKALETTSGTQKYQFSILIISILSSFACSITIFSLPFMFSSIHGDPNATTSFEIIDDKDHTRFLLINQFYIGILLSIIPSSLFLDKFGRAAILKFIIPYFIALSLISSLALTYRILFFTLLLLGFVFYTLMISSLILLSESIPYKSIPMFLLLISLSYVLGQLYTSLMYICKINWRITLGSSGLIGFLTNYYAQKILESPEWVYLKNHIPEAEKIFMAISAVNNVGVFKHRLIEKNNITSFANYWRMNKRLIILSCILWINAIMGYMIVCLYPIGLNDDIYINALFYFLAHVVAIGIILILSFIRNRIFVLIPFIVLSRIGILLLGLCDESETEFWKIGFLIVVVRVCLDIEIYYIGKIILEEFCVEIRSFGLGLCLAFGVVGGFFVLEYPLYSSYIGILGFSSILAWVFTASIRKSKENEEKIENLLFEIESM
ncbi:hypothetical protein SteCoe_30198 [Stentor coeruleus]|uniref:Major facilitator superfamily (MFS) profile domain-containing protein n=1 Tax=Stentor coeruleus TaxID=5963 RepID=A0A1R2B444_9CILI|nr:hypothetical protein SteCoe_30198 [Stentor coeruleus]